MPWILYLFGSGLAIFVAAGMILAAVALLPRTKGWKAKGLGIVVLIGLAIVIVSGAPLSYWLYAVAIGMTLVWLRLERKGSEQWTVAARRATAAIWIGIVLLELPQQFSPHLTPLGNPPLYVIGDSVTAGMGGSNGQTWTRLLPEHVQVHNLARPGAMTASASKNQVPQIPADAKLVLIEIGGIDLLGGTSSAQFKRDLDALLQQVTRPSANPTVLMLELPLPPLSNEYGRIQRRLASRHNVRLVPKRVFMSVLASDGATLDGIHLSEAGHRRMADAVWRVIEPAYRSN
jgi:acyl-CoA thioesterase-1